jgi:hypothetical protein
MVISDILSTYEDRFAIQAQVSIPGVWGWALKKQNRKDWPPWPMFEKSRTHTTGYMGQAG